MPTTPTDNPFSGGGRKKAHRKYRCGGNKGRQRRRPIFQSEILNGITGKILSVREILLDPPRPAGQKPRPAIA